MKAKSNRYVILSFLLSIVLVTISCTHHLNYKTGSWGDQGDGTYKNPILNADYPDIDIEQVEDTYYMISSKQHMSPGMVILESKDMVNWAIIGHVWDKLNWAPEYNWDSMSGYSYGVWAGDIAYHEGTYYCYQIDFNHGLYVSTAEDIRGPWSKSHQMLSTELVMDDPAVFWDDDTHEAYLICNTGRKQNPDKNKKLEYENRIYKMSWDGLEVLDLGKLVYTGIGSEAAKIYKIEGTWYIFISEWYKPDPRKSESPEVSINDRKQIVLRSTTKSIYGPYEKKIVLERGNGIARSCSQGALIQAPDSSWWYMHQLIQNTKNPFQGRPQCLEPVTWIDGWPIIGEDIDKDGIGEPVLSFKKPINNFSIKAPQTDDEFESNTLGAQWEWNHNPRDSHWSVTERSGWLRLKASVPVDSGGFWNAGNTISQRIMGSSFGAAVTKVDLSGMAIGQRAGFVRFGGVYHLLGIYINENGKRQLFFMDNKGVELKGPILKNDYLYIKTKNDGNQAFFEYSTNGKDYLRYGPIFTIKFGKWTGDRLGFFCWNNSKEEGYFDIDYFHYDYDGPKAI